MTPTHPTTPIAPAPTIPTSATTRFPLLPLLALAALTLMLPACSGQKTLWQAGASGSWPFADVAMRVETVTARGDYFAAVLATSAFSIEIYLPSTKACHALFVPGAELNYLEGSPGGRYKSGDWVCESAGIGTLLEWRKRRARPRTTGSLIARGHASYQLVYQDDEVAFLRGRFPLSGRLGFAELGDTIAVVSKTPECEAPIARSTSSMEYYPTGKKVLTLVSTHGQCLITGLIAPFGQGRPSPSS